MILSGWLSELQIRHLSFSLSSKLSYHLCLEIMGNCQAAEAATVVIQHPSGRVERIYWSLSASQVMSSNPGHYVAAIITTVPSSTSSAAAAVKHLKLLRPDDTLHIGHVYRLVSFEEVLKEFTSKKRVKLSKLLAQPHDKKKKITGSSGATKRFVGVGCRGVGAAIIEPRSTTSMVVAGHTVQDPVKTETVEVQWTTGSSTGRSSGSARYGQWRPALQSIEEAGT